MSLKPSFPPPCSPAAAAQELQGSRAPVGFPCLLLLRRHSHLPHREPCPQSYGSAPTRCGGFHCRAAPARGQAAACTQPLPASPCLTTCKESTLQLEHYLLHRPRRGGFKRRSPECEAPPRNGQPSPLCFPGQGTAQSQQQVRLWGWVLFNVCLSRQDSMINLARGCADFHGYGISVNVSPPTGPQTQQGFGKRHGKEGTETERSEFTDAVCFLFNRQQGLSGRGSLSTRFLKEVDFGPLTGQQPLHSSLCSRFLIRRKEATEAI